MTHLMKITKCIYVLNKNTGYIKTTIDNFTGVLNCPYKDTECNPFCTQYEMLDDGNIKLWCTGRIIKIDKIK